MTERITVLGLGNILCGDDAFGVFAAELLYSSYDFPPNVSVIDGGTQGHTLNGFVEESDRLLVYDAADFGLAPWSLSVYDKAEMPVWLGLNKISPHQNSFSETLALASLRGDLPAEIRLIALQPELVEFGADISPQALAKLPEALDLGLSVLREWGILPAEAAEEKHLLNAEMLKKIPLP